MSPLFRRFAWWMQRQRKEDELREELEFHLAEEAEERQADGLSQDQARWAARRSLGNATLLQETTRTLWTWTILEQVAQDLRYAWRTMTKNRSFTAMVVLSLALGIGANTAIFSFMDAILVQSLPVSNPGSLVVMQWRSRVPFGDGFVMHAVRGPGYRDSAGFMAPVFPFPAFERLQQVSASVLSDLFAYHPAGSVNVMVAGTAEVADGEYVSGGYFQGLGVTPAAGRLILGTDDRAGAAPVAVISNGYSQRRFGGLAKAIGQPVLINNVSFTIVGVAPMDFFGVDPAAAPDLYLPMHADLLIEPGFVESPTASYFDPNYYWIQMMGRLRPGVSREEAQAALRAPFEQWVASTASNELGRANLPVLHLENASRGLDTLRRRYSKPLYVLLAMVVLILALACANAANLLLARAEARRQEIAVRLSIGAGRLRIVRQMLTESLLLALLSGALGVLVAMVGIGTLTRLLANGRGAFTLHAALNWQVLLLTLGLSLLCGLCFGLVPAIQSSRPALMPALKGSRLMRPHPRVGGVIPRLGLTRALVVAQMAISLLLLVAAGLFVRTLSNLESVPLGFNPSHVLLFDVNAPQAGLSESQSVRFYVDLRRRLSEIPGVTGTTLSRSSLIRAGMQLPISVKGEPAMPTRVLLTGPGFFTTMQVPVLRGAGIDDRQEASPVVVVSERFAKAHFRDENPLGQSIRLGLQSTKLRSGNPLDFTVIGVAANTRYGGLKGDVPPVVYIPYEQVAILPLLGQMTYALRTEGDPLRYVDMVRKVVHGVDPRVPVTHALTQVTDINRTINQEIVFARLCSAFGALALIIACVGLFGTMAYGVARRTREIGIRMALGARRGRVVWMVLREGCLLAALGLAIGMPIALATSRVIQSFLFNIEPDDPATLVLAAAILLSTALLAGYGPARRASRISPMIALRQD